MNANFRLIPSLGLFVVCFTYPYILLGTNLDILSFLSTLSLYVQGMVLTNWILVKINGYVIQAVSCSDLIQ